MVDRNSYFGFAVPNAKISAMALFSKKTIHEVAYMGRPGDRGKAVLVNKKTY